MYSIQIVPATIDDAALIAEISRETFYDTYAADNTKEDMDLYLTTKFSDEQILAELQDPLHLFLLAYVGNTLAGYVKLKDSTHGSLETDPAMEVRLAALDKLLTKEEAKAFASGLLEELVRNGEGVRLRPTSSSTIPASTWPMPSPPSASATRIPVKPSSANCFHKAWPKPSLQLISR